jgi:HEAT repeat protein
VWLKKGKVLHARACRIGFKDSSEVRFKLDDKISGPKPPKTPAKDDQHWRHKLDKTDLLAQLSKIKELDGQGRSAIPEFYKALKDEHASVRYWAVIGLHNHCTWPVDKIEARATLKNMLDDPAAVVRIAAAHAICDWGNEQDALPVLPVLAKAIEDKTDKARLHAIIALSKIGVKARPLLPQIKAKLKDSDDDVQRVAKTTLKMLEENDSILDTRIS